MLFSRTSCPSSKPDLGSTITGRQQVGAVGSHELSGFGGLQRLNRT
jgi:hypothetical protein